MTTTSATVKVSDSSFEADVLTSSQPVLVDFWATWCGPCRQMEPTLEDIATELKGKLTIAKVNIDENPVAPAKYGVRGIPTLMLFKDGKVAGTKLGALPKHQLKTWVDSFL